MQKRLFEESQNNHSTDTSLSSHIGVPIGYGIGFNRIPFTKELFCVC